MFRHLRGKPLALSFLALTLGCSTYLGYEGFLLRQEARAFDAGQYEEAVRLAGPVKLLRGPLTAQLKEQADVLADRGVGARELPLLELTGALTESPALKARLEAARLELAAPQQLRVMAATVSYQDHEPEVADVPATDHFREEIENRGTSEWGEASRLYRLAPGAASWELLGEGFSGLIGSSYELSEDGNRLLYATEQGLEVVALASGERQAMPTPESPELIAPQPKTDWSRPVVAYSVAGERGDALYMYEDGRSRRLYPPEGSPLLSWLSFKWAPDGRSMLLEWEEAAPEDGKTITQVVWMRPDGVVGFEAALESRLKDVDVDWAPAPNGRRMVLELDGGHWLWDAGASSAQPLLGVGGMWGWGPDSRKIAGIDQGSFYVLDADEPAKRMQQAVAALPKLLTGEPEDVSWKKDHLKFDGLTMTGAGGVIQEAVVNVRLGLK